MPDGGASIAALLFETGIQIGAFEATTAQILAAVAVTASAQDQQRRVRHRMADAAAAATRDRYLMIRGATEARRIALGRQRVSGPVAFIESAGADRTTLGFVVLMSAEEVDGFEQFYIDDELAELDGSGNVISVQRRDTYAISTASSTVTLSSELRTGSVSAWVDYGSTRVPLTVTAAAGTSVSVSGATAGVLGTLTVQYRPATSPFVSTQGSDDASVTFALDGAGSGGITLPAAPISGSVRVVASSGSGQDQMDVDVTAATSVVGASVTVTGAVAAAGLTVRATYRVDTSLTPVQSRLQIRPFTGAAGQTADSVLMSLFPGKITSAHTFAGQAGVVVIGDYDPDAFPSGLPNISATVRGSKVLDVRTGVRAWSENPALLARHVATHPLLGRQPAAAMHDVSIAAAANVCDTSTSYVVDGQTHVRPLYTAGLVARTDQRGADILDDLCDAMAGRWVIADGLLRMRAGAWVTPLQDLTEAWLAAAVDSSPTAMDLQANATMEGSYNTVTGTFVDASRAYQELDYPTVRAAEYVAADGQEIAHPDGIQLPAVTFVGQAQQVVASLMRDARMGQAITLECNMRAMPVEAFDVLRVTLPEFGWAAKLFEVLKTSWTPAGTIKLVLKATDPSIWAVGTSFAAAPLHPPTRLPSPWYVPAVQGLACYSGTSELQTQSDGTVVSTLRITWTPITDAYVVESGGGVEVKVGLAADPESAWRTIDVPQGSSVRVGDLKDGRIYLVKARAYTANARGQWTVPTLHQVAAKSVAPAAPPSVTAAAQPGGVLVSWPAPTEGDWLDTEVRVGSSWAGGTRVCKGRVTSFVWDWPASGTYTLRVRHRNRSGLESGESTAAITVGSNVLIGTGVLDAGSTYAAPVATGGASWVGEPPTASSTNKNVAVHTVTWTNDTGIAVPVQIAGGITNSSLGWNVAMPTNTQLVLEWSSASLSGSAILCNKWPDASYPGMPLISPSGFSQVMLPAGETITAVLRVILVHSAAAEIDWASSHLSATAFKR